MLSQGNMDYRGFARLGQFGIILIHPPIFLNAMFFLQFILLSLILEGIWKSYGNPYKSRV